MFMTHKINAKSAYGKIGLVLILLFISLLSLRFGSAEMTDAEFFGGLLTVRAMKQKELFC